MESRTAIRSLLTLLLVAALLLAGCSSGGVTGPPRRTTTAQQPTPAPAPAPAPARQTAPAPAPAPARLTAQDSTGARPSAGGRCGSSVASQMYPAQGAVRLDVQAPPQVALNAPFEFTIRATNVSDVMVSEVVVKERLPGNFRLQGSNPPASATDGQLIWALGSLDPKASREMKVMGMATSAECLRHCATVDFVVPTCSNIEVVEPKLALTKTAPAEVLLCDPIPVSFVVTNSGTGDIQGVRVLDTLPPGLETADGKNQIAVDAGTLAAGQSKKFAVNLKAARTGTYINRAVATSASGLKAEAETRTIVHQPVLAITKTGPERLFLGRPLTYQITVTNKGDAPAVNTVVEDTLPAGVRQVQASTGGTVSGGKVVWQVGTLAINASRTLSVTYTPATAEPQVNTVTAVAACADAVTASARTSVEGIAAVLLEVVDISDPIEVGGQETYVITATNQGSATDHNVQITCVLEDAQEYVSSDGPTRATAEGRTIRFAPLGTLPAKQKATWRVVVKALRAGDIRFSVTMNTQELGRPVEETEATRQY